MMNYIMSYTSTWWYVAELFMTVGIVMFEIAKAKAEVDW